MSSLRSAQPPDGLEALGAAVRQVAEDSLFACAEPCERSRTARLLEARPVTEPWLTAAIAFSGPFDGVVRMTLPRALAGDLAGAFCGVQPQSLDASPIARLRRRAGQHGLRAVADADRTAASASS